MKALTQRILPRLDAAPQARSAPTNALDDALACCAADAGVPAEQLHATRLRVSAKSDLFEVRRERTRRPLYLVKTEPPSSAWSPQREAKGLLFVARHAQRDQRHGAARVVGWKQAPKWLVTQYCPGRSVGRIVDAAVRRGGVRRMRPAMRCVARMADWLAAFRAWQPAEPAALTQAGYVAFLEARLNELAAHYRVDEARDNILAAVRQWLSTLDDHDVNRLLAQHPAHGDFMPQNFLINDNDQLIALDFESFGSGPLNIDVFKLRYGLERAKLRGPNAARRAKRLWRCFINRYADEREQTRCLLAYVYHALAEAAWVGRGVLPPRRPLIGWIKAECWVTGRLRWFARLPRDLVRARAYLAQTL